MFRFEQTREATYDVTGWNVESRSRFVIPSHKFKHNYYNRVKVDGTVYDSGHDFMWGKTNDGPEKMKKIGFACSQNKIWAIGMTESKLVFKRKLQAQDEQLIMFRFTNGNGNDFGSGDKYNEVEFKAEHPKTPTMNVNYKIRFEHNSNHELTKGKLSIKRKWGNEPKFVEFTSNMVLNKIDGSILLKLVLPDATRWKIEGAVTASNVLGELRHGFNAKLIRNNKIHRSLVITVYPVIHAIQLETVKFDTRDQNLGKTFKMFAGFIDEDADKFAVRMIHKNQASTVNHFVDHSVASLVNAIDGIGQSADEISVFVQLTDDGDVLASNVTWPPQLAKTASTFLQETKAALQRAHADSDNFGGSNPSLLKVIREVRKIGGVFDSTIKGVFSDIMYVLEGGDVVNQYTKVMTFISKNFNEAARYINLHTGIGKYLKEQLHGLGEFMGRSIEAYTKIFKSFHVTVQQYVEGITTFVSSHLDYLRRAIIDIRKEVLTQIIDLIPNEVDVQIVADYVKDAAQQLRSTILKFSRVYRRIITRFSSKIELTIINMP